MEEHKDNEEAKWVPTGKECYDKPAGVPIRHEETLDVEVNK